MHRVSLLPPTTIMLLSRSVSPICFSVLSSPHRYARYGQLHSMYVGLQENYWTGGGGGFLKCWTGFALKPVGSATLPEANWPFTWPRQAFRVHDTFIGAYFMKCVLRFSSELSDPLLVEKLMVVLVSVLVRKVLVPLAWGQNSHFPVLRIQCWGFRSGSACFWASWIRIHSSDLRIRIRSFLFLINLLK